MGHSLMGSGMLTPMLDEDCIELLHILNRVDDIRRRQLVESLVPLRAQLLKHPHPVALRLPFHDGRDVAALAPAQLGDRHVRGVGDFAVRVHGAAGNAIDVQVVGIDVGELDLRASRRVLVAEILPHGAAAGFVVELDVAAVFETEAAAGPGGRVADRTAAVAAAGDAAGSLAVPGEDVAVRQRRDQRGADGEILVPRREGEVAARVWVDACACSDGWIRAGSASVAVDGGIGCGGKGGEEEEGESERARHGEVSWLGIGSVAAEIGDEIGRKSSVSRCCRDLYTSMVAIP